jgi:hypothetical protein
MQVVVRGRGCPRGDPWLQAVSFTVGQRFPVLSPVVGPVSLSGTTGSLSLSGLTPTPHAMDLGHRPSARPNLVLFYSVLPFRTHTLVTLAHTYNGHWTKVEFHQAAPPTMLQYSTQIAIDWI